MVVGRALLRLSSLHKSSGEHLHLWLPLKDRKLRLLSLSCFFEGNIMFGMWIIFKLPKTEGGDIPLLVFLFLDQSQV